MAHPPPHLPSVFILSFSAVCSPPAILSFSPFLHKPSLRKPWMRQGAPIQRARGAGLVAAQKPSGGGGTECARYRWGSPTELCFGHGSAPMAGEHLLQGCTPSSRASRHSRTRPVPHHRRHCPGGPPRILCRCGARPLAGTSATSDLHGHGEREQVVAPTRIR